MSPEVDIRTARRVHMVGIGGAGMAALAALLIELEKRVSGSDLSGAELEGATIVNRHDAANVPSDADYVIRSSAVPTENPEVVEAARRGLPNRKLAEAV